MMDRETLLLLQAKHGDRKAFELFVEHFWKPIFNLAYRFTGNKQDAEDLCQETFLIIYRKAGTFRGEGKAFTWLFSIATNICLNWKKRQKPFLSIENAEKEAALKPDSIENLARLELREALLRLEAGDRLLLLLKKFYGFSYAEMGEILSLSEAKIKSRLHEAKMRLAQKMNPLLKKGGEPWIAKKSNPG